MKQGREEIKKHLVPLQGPASTFILIPVVPHRRYADFFYFIEITINAPLTDMQTILPSALTRLWLCSSITCLTTKTFSSLAVFHLAMRPTLTPQPILCDL